MDGKVAFTTGAGSGIAKALSRVFQREGAKVVVSDLSGAEVTTAAELGDGVVPFHCDVSKEGDVEAHGLCGREIVLSPNNSLQPFKRLRPDEGMS